MNENILKALIQLFALVIDIDKSKKLPRREIEFVESFLHELLNKDLIPKYMQLFNEYLSLYSSYQDDIPAKKKRKRITLDAMKVMAICEQINQGLEQKQKTFVLLKLMEFISLDEILTEKELDFVLSVATAFNIDETEYLNCKNFVCDTLESIPEKQRILIISPDRNPKKSSFLTKYIGDISGEIVFLHMLSTNTFAFRFKGNQDIYLNGQSITPKRVYIFETGSSLRSANAKTVYYTDIVKEFMSLPGEISLSLMARDIVFKFKNSENGVHVRDLAVNAGQLVGVMGASGSGKSTFLNILNGNIKPQKGKVLINGHDLYDENNKALFIGVIGYIAQDDILFEELTVYQNLYFNARLCLNNYSGEEREKLIEKMLYDLDLMEIKDLVVGNVLNKFISGGQRKRLNIALELIREPSILFVDEPTSGLSSLDSEIVMNLLKEQTLKGKLVIVNIHQPSSDIFKMFDKILFLDKGGYLIFSGNPVDSITYFKSKSNHVNLGQEQCYECGNVNTEQLLQIIEARFVNEHGKLTRTRKKNPKEWFDLFQSYHEKSNTKNEEKRKFPNNLYSIPGKFKQFLIFLNRDLSSKLTNKQYLLISLLEAPVLAVFLGYFTKYIGGKSGNQDLYIFQENVNLPAFIFMSVVIALFIGLSISAEEIIKDRKHLKRESFLGLNNNSYLDSKISLLFLISAIQMLTFVIIGNFILEIKGMTFHFWLMLFTTSCFANILGLNLSSALNSVITIYILIPFILVPEILFSGAMVQYDKLHKSITSQVYVPVVGDVMTSRWAYEALVVHQFKTNKFQKNFFEIKKEVSAFSYYTNLLLPRLKESLSYCEMNIVNPGHKREVSENLKLIKYEIEKLGRVTGISFKKPEQLNMELVSSEILKEANRYLLNLRKAISEDKSEAYRRYDKIYNDLVNSLGGENEFNKFKEQYHNKSIDDLVTRRYEYDKIIRVGNKFVQLKDPIYKKPDSQYGRAHFYSSGKQLGNLEIDTYWFNLAVIWLSTIVLYFALRGQILRKLFNSLGNLKHTP